MSINNGNAFLTALLYPDGFISEDTYTILWSNLRLQIFYGKDEWVMDYWEQASQNMICIWITFQHINKSINKH